MPAKQVFCGPHASISDTTVVAGRREARGDRSTHRCAQVRIVDRGAHGRGLRLVGRRTARAAPEAASPPPRATGPAPGRSGAASGVESPSAALSLPRISSSIRPSSNAQVEDTAVTCERPVAGDALRPRGTRDRRADRVRPRAGHLGEHPRVGDACTAQRAPHGAVEALHHAARTSPGVTASSCAGASGSASAPVAVTSVWPTRAEPRAEQPAAVGVELGERVVEKQEGRDAPTAARAAPPRRGGARAPPAAARPASRTSAGHGRPRRCGSRRGAGRCPSCRARGRAAGARRARRASVARRRTPSVASSRPELVRPARGTRARGARARGGARRRARRRASRPAPSTAPSRRSPRDPPRPGGGAAFRCPTAAA